MGTKTGQERHIYLLQKVVPTEFVQKMILARAIQAAWFVGALKI